MSDQGEPLNKPTASAQETLRAVLHWYRDMGIDVPIQNATVDYFSLGAAQKRTIAAGGNLAPALAKPRQPVKSVPSGTKTAAPARPTTAIMRPDAQMPSPDEAIVLAQTTAQACASIDALAAAIAAFNGCPLKKGARKTVFGTGVQTAPLLVLGEAPGQDEDRVGEPFVGRAGLLLDKMLEAIDHSRKENVYISNVIYWRPPGNRTPSDEEMAICKPFVDRLITLMKPQIIMVAGATSLKAVQGKTGIMKTRGKWQTFKGPDGDIPVMPTFHPAYLLRNPEAKRLVWQDLQALRARLSS